MLYSKFYLKKEVKIPTLLSLFIVGLSVYFIGRFLLTTSIPSRAQKGEIKKFEYVNILPSQATIVWITEKPGNWWILYGKSPFKLDKTALDVRSVSSQKINYKNHFVILKDLQPSTKYYLKLTDGKNLIADLNNQPFSFETIEKFPPNSNIKPAFGKIVNNNKEPVENALVIMSIENSHKLAALTKNSGEWLIPTNYIINSLTKKQKILSSNEKVMIEIVDELENKSKIETILSNLSPISGEIIIGQNYNLTEKEEILGESISNYKIGDIDFIYPGENSIIASNYPLIKGVGIPGNDIKITIKGNDVLKTYDLSVKKNGSWNISTPVSLLPGKYVLTLTTKDKNNQQIKKSRNFQIAKSGEQVLGEATPSSVIETTQPTIATSTPEPTLEPTLILTEIPTATPKPTIPVTGGTIIPLSIVSASLIVIGIALLAL